MSSLNLSISFLYLPADLRIKVYKYASYLLAQGTRLHFCTDQDTSSHRKPIVTALLETCRTIAYRAAPILYGRNCFKAINSTLFFSVTRGNWVRQHLVSKISTNCRHNLRPNIDRLHSPNKSSMGTVSSHFKTKNNKPESPIYLLVP